VAETSEPQLHGIRMWWAGARPRTLPAAIVPVLVGTAAAAGVPRPDQTVLHGFIFGGITAAGEPFHNLILWRMVAAMVVALAIQVATNYANDYSDGKRGTDDPGQRVGPPRLVGWGLASPGAVKRACMISFGVAALAGLTLAWAVGWWLILVGLVCFAAGWFYTGGPRPYGYAGLGEVFVFVFFGLVATVGSGYVQSEQLVVSGIPADHLSRAVASYPWVLVSVAVAVGCLATALLVTNNLRDIPSDTVAGKRTLAVKLGDHRTRILYTVLVVLPFVIVVFACGAGGRLAGSLSLFAILLANPPMVRIWSGARGRDLIPVLAQTARVQLVFGVILAIGLYVSV
jgi:1,4-dihydroxy-2-naphthoate octaprenyltransferase